ncbi:class I SAM-dependent methyltransferase [Haloarchaeobius sp. HRN-SO-5]|uniref:class I SAM-dependent methyltransferase n=1 Tax=Haloarchaeobius sp. HRN-SO-5 TaxID=3446118 RepID=UPI003EB6C4A6
MTDTDEAADIFAGTEEYYASHRPGYGEETVAFLRERFDLDGSERVLDLGCGAGQIAIPLASHVGSVVGMDPNEAMLRQAEARAAEAGVENVEWVVGSDADVDADLGTVDLTTMGRSFHWMDQAATLDRIHDVTAPGGGGGVAIVTDGEWLTKGTEPWQETVYAVADRYLDDLPERVHPDDVDYDPWDELVASRGFDDARTDVVEFDREWDVDGIVGYVFSLSFCSPERFGDDAADFEADLRETLADDDADTFVQHVTVSVVTGVR